MLYPILSVLAVVVASEAPLPGPVFELLTFTVPCGSADRWLRVDHDVWTNFLRRHDGFVEKFSLVDYNERISWNASSRVGDQCAIWSLLQWSSKEQWEMVTLDPDYASMQPRFDAAYNGSQELGEFFGLSLYIRHSKQSEHVAPAGFLEPMRFNVSCHTGARFTKALAETMSEFYSQQDGFIKYYVLEQRADHNDSGSCNFWTWSLWRSMEHRLSMDLLKEASAFSQLAQQTEGAAAVLVGGRFSLETKMHSLPSAMTVLL